MKRFVQRMPGAAGHTRRRAKSGEPGPGRRIPALRTALAPLLLLCLVAVALAPSPAAAHPTAVDFADANPEDTFGGDPPNAPDSATATSGPGSGQISVSWTQPTSGPAVTIWSVWGRVNGTTGSYLRLVGCRHGEQSASGTTHSCTATHTRSSGVNTLLTAGTAYDLRLVLAKDAGTARNLFAQNVVAKSDVTAPAYSSAAVDLSKLTATFGEALATDHKPDAGDFTITGGSTTRTVTAVAFQSGDAKKLDLTLSTPVGYNEVIQLSYTPHATDASKRLQDAAANEVAAFSNKTVTNNTVGVSVAVDNASLAEAAGTATFTAKLTGASSQQVTVTYALGGTATHGTDYTSTPSGSTGTLTFAANTTSQTVTVTGVDDSAAEGGETITLTLSSPTNAAVVTGTASTTIADDDVPSVSSATVNGTALQITFSQTLKSTAAGTPVPGAFTVMVGGAERDVASGGVSISGSTVTLTLVSGVAAGEAVTVAYDKPATGGKLQNTVSLDVATFAARTVRNDTPPDVSVTAGSATVAEAGGTATFTVRLSGAASQPVSVTYTLGGTATHGTDYTSTPSGATGTLTFPVGTTSQTVWVTAVDDSIAEGAETITLTLSNPMNASVVTASAGIGIADDEKPHPSAASVAGRSVVITFTEPLDPTAAGRPGPGAFTVTVGSARRSVASGGVLVSGNTVVLTLVSAVAAGETVTVAYDEPASGGKLRNPSGLEVDTFGAQTVSHATPQAPAVTGVEVNGDRLEVTFDRALAPNRRPSASRFTVEQYFPSWSRVSVRRVEVDPADVRRLVLTLSRSVRTGAAQPVRMSYTGSRDSNGLRGVYDSERVRDFGGVAVANLTPVPRWGDPEYPRLVQSGWTYWTNIEGNDIPCGRARPSETRAEADLRQMYVCDMAQRKWMLAQFARPGIDYRSDLEINWVLVSDWGHVREGACILRGYDDLRGTWLLMSTSWRLLCQRAGAAVQGVEGQAMAFHVALKNAPAAGERKSVDYATVDGTAVAGEDYEAASGTLTFGPGEAVKTVHVRTLRDRRGEASETMSVRLSNARGFTLVEAEKAGVILEGAAATPVEAAIVSDPGADRTYGRGDTVRVRLTWGGPVEVDPSGGTPRLKIKMDPDYGEKWALYESGSGTASLDFAFGPVARPNLSPRGVAVLADTLEANGGTIRIAGTGDAAPLAHAGLAHDPDHKVDHRVGAPPVLTVAGAGGPGWFPVRVAFPAAVSGPPVLSAGIAGGGGAAVTEVTEAEPGRAWTARVAADGPSRMWVRAARGNGQAAVLVVDVDAAGNATPVAGPAVVAATIAAPASGTSWVAGEEVSVWLAFSEPVTVDTAQGTPGVGLSVDGTAVRAAQRGGSGMSWRFAWTVPEGGTVSHAALAADSLVLGGAVIRDGAGRDADLKHPGAERGTMPAPAVTAAFVGPEAHGGAGAELTLRVDLSRPADLNAFALGVEGGSVVLVTPMGRGGGHEAWGVVVAVESADAVTVTLAAKDGGPRLGNAPSLTVPGPAPAVVVPQGLTASFADLPAEHDGRRLFRFELRFSENFPGRFDYRTLRDHAFEIGNGRVVEAKRAARGQNRRWTIAVRPASYEDVTISLPAASDCTAAGSVCTEAGRKLSNTVTATVPGPAALSVADARAKEGVDETIDFVVSLHKAAAGVVTVDYETVDGSAKAGEDYVAASGTLTFEVGETEKTVAVTVLDDAKDEGEETFRLRLSNAVGAYLLDRVAVGTIENADPLQQAWLARFGRTVGSQAIDAIGSRFEGGGGAAQVTIGGQTLALGGAAALEAADGAGAGADDSLRFSEAWRAAFGEKQEAEESRTMEGRELLLGSSFNLSAGGENGAPRYGAWGRFAVGSFDAELDGLSLSGEVTTGFLGADVDAGRWLAGAALSVSEGEGPFTLTGAQASNRKSGTIGSTLTSVWPYARLKAGERLDLWAMAGLGRGTMTVDEDGGAPIETDIGMSMGAVGAKGALVEPGPEGGIALGLRTDAMWVRTESDAVRSAERGNLEGATAEVTRLRVILDASRAFALDRGGTLTPALELGLRQDGGDAETGTGVELGARLGYAADGVAVEGAVRGLLAHEDESYEEWGASASVRIDPGASGRGLSLTLAPAWGNAASGAERLWGARDAAELAPGGAFEATSRLDAELGYGFPGPYGLGTVTPYAGLGLAGEAQRTWRTGARWRLHAGSTLDLEATRSTAGAGTEPGHGLMLRLESRW